jgi:DNA-binding transcriptional ArsR family regulator
MARETGLEPATSGVTGRRSNQLSYSPATRRRNGRTGDPPDRIGAGPSQARQNAGPGGLPRSGGPTGAKPGTSLPWFCCMQNHSPFVMGGRRLRTLSSALEAGQTFVATILRRSYSAFLGRPTDHLRPADVRAAPVRTFIGVIRTGLTDGPFFPILSYMVNYNERLGRTFAALVDPTRRTILARLEREDGASVSALAQPFAIKLPAVMKHLDVLDDAGLITRSKVGRTVTVQLRPEPMREAMDWLRRYERFWLKSLDRLAAYAESKEAKARKKKR